MKRHIVLIEALLIGLSAITCGYSYYAPNQGRWLSRDPRGEIGNRVLPLGPRNAEDEEFGCRLVGETVAFNNNPISYVDPDGRMARLIPRLIPTPSLGGPYIPETPWRLIADVPFSLVTRYCFYEKTFGHYSDMIGQKMYKIFTVDGCKVCPP